MPCRLPKLPLLRALSAQVLALPLLWLLLQAWPPPRSLWALALVQGGLAAAGAAWWGLGRGWRVFQVLLPLALAFHLERSAPGWLYPAVLLPLGLVFGGGILTRVPLYNSNRAAWAALADLLPADRPFTFVDLGAGLGGPLAFLARRIPEGRFRGVEASPLVWLAAWLRTRPAGVRMRLGSLWSEDLRGVEVAYAFLSPTPMGDLWVKVCRDMAPGTLLVSHSFEVPGVQAERVIPLPGRPGACLRLYRVQSQAGR